MATKTIGASGKDYTTIAAWSAYVKAIGTLTEDELGQLTDDAEYGVSGQADTDMNSVTLDGFEIILESDGSNRYDGDFDNGSRIVDTAQFGGMLRARQIIIQDISIENTQTTSGGARAFVASNGTFNRCAVKANSSGGNSHAFQTNSGGPCVHEACRYVAVVTGISLEHESDQLSNCCAFDAADGIVAAVTHTGTIKNTSAYGTSSSDWTGTFSGAYSNNASEDADHPGASGVTISGDPYDADGYTPASSGQLDGAGVDLSISLDAANNSFNATPSIGAYESIGVAPTGRIMSSLTNHGGLAGKGGIAGIGGGLAG